MSTEGGPTSSLQSAPATAATTPSLRSISGRRLNLGRSSLLIQPSPSTTTSSPSFTFKSPLPPKTSLASPRPPQAPCKTSPSMTKRKASLLLPSANRALLLSNSPSLLASPSVVTSPLASTTSPVISPTATKLLQQAPSTYLETRVQQIQQFVVSAGLTGFDGDMVALFDILKKKGVDKIVLSGFGNGSRGHARIPDSLLGGLHNSQMIIVKCSSTGLPTVTEKFFLARARGLMVLSSGFLTAWSSHGKVPVLAEYPVVCEMARRYGKREPLLPITTPFFMNQTFCFLNTASWRLSPETVSAAITLLGGKVITVEERARSQSKVFCISNIGVRGELVYRYSWVINMVVAGRSLRREAYLVQDEEVDMCSQVGAAFVSRKLNNCFAGHLNPGRA